MSLRRPYTFSCKKIDICIPEILNTNTRTQIQRVILYSKTDFKIRFKDFWHTKI